VRSRRLWDLVKPTARSAGPIEKSKDLWDLAGPRHTADQTAIGSLIPLPTLSHDVPEPLKATLKIVVAEEQSLEGPEGCRDGTSSTNGFYTPQGQDSRTLVVGRGS
jgi:hypothetical protein